MSLFLLNLRFDQQENSPHRYPNTDLLTVKCDHPEIRINSLVFLLKKNNYHPSLPIQKLCPWLQRNILEAYQPRQCQNNQSLKKIGATLVHPARSCLSTRVTSSQWWAGHPLCLFPQLKSAAPNYSAQCEKHRFLLLSHLSLPESFKDRSKVLLHGLMETTHNQVPYMG